MPQPTAAQAEQQARTAAETAASGAALGAKAIASALILGLGAADRRSHADLLVSTLKKATTGARSVGASAVFAAGGAFSSRCSIFESTPRSHPPLDELADLKPDANTVPLSQQLVLQTSSQCRWHFLPRRSSRFPVLDNAEVANRAAAEALSAEDAVSLIVNGFCKEVLKELPMEFAVEAQKLLAVTRQRGHLETTLDTFEVPAAERAEVLGFINSTKADIVE